MTRTTSAYTNQVSFRSPYAVHQKSGEVLQRPRRTSELGVRPLSTFLRPNTFHSQTLAEFSAKKSHYLSRITKGFPRPCEEVLDCHPPLNELTVPRGPCQRHFGRGSVLSCPVLSARGPQQGTDGSEFPTPHVSASQYLRASPEGMHKRNNGAQAEANQDRCGM